ncbi:MAG: nucleotidyltransferase family protein [Bacteroidales bacterium]|nr:nucleotidyltransferase family protein [Bacteroidales bacterium]
MKAFLLAAGLGTRLKPITDKIPKCLVPINNKPLLCWWFDLLEKHNVDEILINLHYLPNLVEKFVKSYKTKIKVTFFYEEKLLGSAGTLRENKNFIKDENAFFILYADNLTNINLSYFLNYFNNSNSIFNMALFKTNNPKTCGIAELDKNNTVVDFVEKPKLPKSNLANAGVYIAKPEVLDLIPTLEVTDFGYHVLPQLVGKMKGYIINDFLIDIGTIENLKKAEENWMKLKH